MSHIKFIIISKSKKVVSYVPNNSEAGEVKLIGLIYQRSERDGRFKKIKTRS